MTLIDNSNFIIENCVEEEIDEVVTETKKNSARRSLFDDIDYDEEIVIDQQNPQQSEEIKQTSEDSIRVWNDSAIKLLIELRRDKDKDFSSARNKNKLWEDISSEMKKKYYFNANVCSNKLRGLKYQFNKVHDNASKKVTECLSTTSFGSPVSSPKTCSKRKSPKISESGRQRQKMLRLIEERATRDEKKITFHKNLLNILTEANDTEKKKVELLEKLLLSKI
ncbi:hypothetical protein ACI65C_004537 [Semiaphis heraclei]